MHQVLIQNLKTIEVLEENIDVNIHELGLGKGFLDRTAKAQVTKEKTDVRLHRKFFFYASQ